MNKIKSSLTITSPVHLLALLLIIVFVAEIFIMLFLKYLNPSSYWVTILIDAALILILMFPGLFYFLFKPMMAQLNEKDLTESILRKSEEKYRNIFNNVQDVYFEVSSEGIITEASPSINRVSNGQYNRNDILGISVIELYTKSDERDLLFNNLYTIGEVHDYEVNLTNKDGSLINCAVSAKLIHSTESKSYKIIGSIRDITSRKKAEEALKRMNEQLKRTNCEKDKLFSIIAHDLRSPFNSLLGFSEIMVTKGNQLSSTEMLTYAGYLNESASNLFSLLENLLLWSCSKQDTLKFKSEELLLQSVVLDVFSLYSEAAMIKEIRLEHYISAEQKIVADNNALQVVLRNLVSNAIKFSHKGGSVQISSSITATGKSEVCISDSGIGMSEAMLKNIFSIDEKVNRKGTLGEQSTGLGLILCKEFVERQGGSIEIESKEGIGTKVIFWL